ncbi:MAG: hypothetical protein HOW73_03390 [Polyangiaceae bacterium]|nr:hypothetical protein [Polyangiaceae bacterium]
MAKQETKKAKAVEEPKKKADPVPPEAEEELDEEEDEEEGEYEDEEEDEEEEQPAKKAPHAASPHKPAEPVDHDQEPGWWYPHAVLGVLVVIGVLGFFGIFNGIVGRFLNPSDVHHSTEGSAHPATSGAAPTAAPTAKPQPEAPPAPKPTVTTAADPDLFGAKRIVIGFKGARALKPNDPKPAERSKEDAKKRADEALKKIRGGSKFDEVAGEFSDEAGAKSTGGNMGNFKRGVYPDLEPTLDKMKPGDMTEVIETAFGYEILQRTK